MITMLFSIHQYYPKRLAQSVGAVEYTEWISAEELDPHQLLLDRT